MANVLLSFLGTNKYLQCNYYYGDKTIKSVHYVQEAIVKLFCNEWGKNDKIIVFVTEEAYNTNWIRGISYEDEDIGGLQSVLTSFAHGKKITVQHVKIADAQNENDIWKIFEAVVESVNEGDEIIVDITHAFRAIPMLAVVMINYLQLVKNVTFKGLYYGAVESLGRIPDIAKMEKKDRNAPIIDLSSFIYLLQFSNAVYNFLQYGDAKDLSRIALNTIEPILKQSKGSDNIARSVSNVSNQLRSMTQNFAYCRGKNIVQFNYARLYQEVQTLRESFSNDFLSLKPLQPLLNKILQKLEPFEGYDENINAIKGILAAQWCLDHNLIQQSITILLESIITLVCINNSLDYIKLECRELVKDAFLEMRPKNKSSKKNENKNLETLLNDTVIKSLCKEFDKLNQLRNDINHANFRNDEIKPNKIHQEIQEILEKVKAKLQEM